MSISVDTPDLTTSKKPLTGRSGLKAFGALLRSPSGIVGLVIVALFAILAAVSALGILPFSPSAQDTSVRLQPPSSVRTKARSASAQALPAASSKPRRKYVSSSARH